MVIWSETSLPDGELNPGLDGDSVGYWPLYYQEKSRAIPNEKAVLITAGCFSFVRKEVAKKREPPS